MNKSQTTQAQAAQIYKELVSLSEIDKGKLATAFMMYMKSGCQDDFLTWLPERIGLLPDQMSAIKGKFQNFDRSFLIKKEIESINTITGEISTSTPQATTAKPGNGEVKAIVYITSPMVNTSRTTNTGLDSENIASLQKTTPKMISADHRGMEKEPKDQYQSPEEFAQALTAILSDNARYDTMPDNGQSVLPGSSIEKHRRHFWKKRLIWLTFFGFFLMATFLILWLTRMIR